jgi:hypothetical protein
VVDFLAFGNSALNLCYRPFRYTVLIIGLMAMGQETKAKELLAEFNKDKEQKE